MTSAATTSAPVPSAPITSAPITSAPVVSKMGYQPGLDGLRALSVVLVILYHAGVVRNAEAPIGTRNPWFFDGGFLGVEVFFVVSGFLITSLMLEERSRTGRVVLHQFWFRRFRRLLPALWVMIASCVVWATFWGRDYLADLRSDAFFGLFYAANFQQLAGKVSYFGGLAHLLRHLWSLAVEEHFYLFFPLVFVLVLRNRFTSPRRLLRVVVPAAVLSAVLFVVVWAPPVERLTDNGVQLDDTRQNWAYLSTFTRMAGILIGVSLAVLWAPWKKTAEQRVVENRTAETRRGGRRLDFAGVVAVVVVVMAALVLKSDSPVLYRGGLALVSLLAAVAIAAVVDPRARVMRALFANPVMAAIGLRSYGLYLWHWPIFVGPMSGRSLWERLVIGGLATVVISELCYRLVETPVRRGAVGRWFRTLNRAWVERHRRIRFGLPTVMCVAGFGLLAAALVVRLSTVERTSPSAAAAGPVEEFDQASVLAAIEVSDTSPSVTIDQAVAEATVPNGVAAPIGATVPVTSGPVGTSPEAGRALQAPPIPVPTELPTLPRRIVIVGDSQGDSLFNNLPKGLSGTFAASDGSLQGCGIYDEGGLVTSYAGWSTRFERCKGWEDKWYSATRNAHAEVAVVVLGAWDVFDLDLESKILTFGSPEFDDYWLAQLRLGTDALKRAGASVALVEVACMRPQDVKGQGVPPLPERGDDTRTAHLNELLIRAAIADPTNVFFVSGPPQWCGDEAIARDLFYRWDGVHASRKGGKLIMESIAPELLSIPAQNVPGPPAESNGTS